jgi:3-phenylpropionate/trans-cinnamate dioxygenase ferredoxin subunit
VGGRRVVKVPGVGPVGVFNVDGRYYALKSSCPHQGAPLCDGLISGTSVAVFDQAGLPASSWVRQGEILICPWHGWEFDITTGKALIGDRWRVASYDVVVEQAPAKSVPTYEVVEKGGTVFLVLG